MISVSSYIPTGSIESSVAFSPDTKLIVDLSSLTVRVTSLSPCTAVMPERSALSRLLITSSAPGSSAPPPTAVLLIVALRTSSFTLIVLFSTAVNLSSSPFTEIEPLASTLNVTSVNFV